ncbi:MAG TPA: UDP-N-acetylmuramoyl-L-alanyl-D-glutamate--2,6-diaminopimelate ligase, partial [Candidatus Polarisedimenticolaceae bacterium]|nr:UDP-N-acetylmuramoyl-L-alanyl-D-glutamate--2,6-diaminopimelate ligase [Candidatus Polarisedimenticolaceae bacterium]
MLRGAGVRPVASYEPDPLVRSATLDSRRVEPGDLFFALRGLEVDGVDFVPQAAERGASAIVAGVPRPSWLDPAIAWVEVDEARRAAALLSRELQGRPDLALTLVGITGTNGKTTVSYLIESIARAAGMRAGRIGTVGHAFGDVERGAIRTTPEAPEFYRLLAEMRDASTELVAIEVSSHALALDRVAGARFQVAAFLNLGRDHLDFHQTAAAYFEAKARLFDALDESQWAVVPAGDPRGEQIRRRTTAHVLGFGREAGADVRLRDEHCGVDGSRAVLDTPRGSVPIRTFLLGRFNLDNIAAAAACALSAGIGPDAIAAGALALERVPGRVERIDRGQPFAVVVDYAHTADALQNVLRFATDVTAGRVHVVFGCGGERDRGKRAEMGRVAAASGATIYITSDNPRGEDPERIIDEIEQGVLAVPGGAGRCTRLADRRAAIEAAILAAAADDAVVIAGKGHETTQTVAGRVVT